MRPLDPRLLRHTRAARPFVACCVLLGVATAVLVVAQAELLARLVSGAFLGGSGLGELRVPLLLLGAVVALRALMVWLGEAVAHRASAAVIAQLRDTLLRHVLRPGYQGGGRSSAELAAVATRGLDGLDGYLARYLPQVLLAAVVPATVATWILVHDPTAALVVAVTVPLVPLFMVLVGLHTERDTRRQWRALAVLGNHFLDLVEGLGVLAAFGRAHAQAQSIRGVTEQYRHCTMRTLRVAFLSALVLELLATLSVALVAVSVGLRLVSGSIDLQTALVVIVLAPEVYLPLRAVGGRFHDSAEGLAAAEQAFAVLADEGPPCGGLPAPDPSRVGLRLDSVVVGGGGGPVLDHVSLAVAAGEVVGVTGPSGAGKTTLLDLVLGRRRPDRGRVLVGEVDLAEVSPQRWLERVAWVPQRPRLVAGTVADNIRLGRPEADDRAVRRAAAQAALDVRLDLEVGELGAGLSTGQQRRVALARALLLGRPLLLLDEPTEGVDVAAEAAIIAALPAALAGRSALVVSHRAAVLGVCDRVVALEPAASDTGAGRTRDPAGDGAVTPALRPDGAGTAPPRALDVAAGATRVLGDRRPVTAGWRLLRDAVRPYRRRLVLATALGAGALASGVALTATSAWLIATAALHPPVLSLTVAIVAVRTFGIAKGVLRYAERLTSHDVALRVLAELRVGVWAALARLGPAVTGRLRRGDLLHRLVGDVDSQQDVVVRGVVPVAASALVALATSTGLGLLLPAAGVVTAVGLLCGGVAAPALAAGAARRAERRTSRLRAEVAASTVEVLEAGVDLVVHDAAGRRLDAVARTGSRLEAALRAAALARGLGMAVSVAAVGATSLGCAVVGVAALRAGDISGPVLAVLVLTPLAGAELVAALPETAQRLLGAGHAAARLAALDDLPSPVVDPVAPRSVPGRSALAAQGLDVRWPGAEVDAVRDVDLLVARGRRLVLTGPSGAGKSTVVAALMRHLAARRGRVVLDGTDAALLNGDDVRAAIGWCGPANHLFDSTLRENLRLARPGASDDDLVAALRTARLEDWYTGLPDGLETRLGAHGTPVSGGERQRLGIARTVLCDRPFLLLDEPTAHLDADTAAALAADLVRLTRGRGALVVSHRPQEFASLPVATLAAAPGRDIAPGVTRGANAAGAVGDAAPVA